MWSDAAADQPPSEALSLARRQDGDSVVVDLAGELDMVTAPELLALLETEIASGLALRVDLAGLRFVDSTGIQALLIAARRANMEGFELDLRPPPPRVLRIFELCGLVEILFGERVPSAAAECA